MYRYAIKELVKWKNKQNRKPLIIRGSRQVGKTWLMKEFGAQYYEETLYINFDRNQQIRPLFEENLDMKSILIGLDLLAGHKIDPEKTLLIFDEVQEVPKALTALKYFQEEATQYQILCAGSLLGVALHPGTSFPVGKVEFLDLHPLSFQEFLLAMGKEPYVNILEDEEFTLANTFQAAYTELLKQYYYVGGMPEAVNAYQLHHDFKEVREIQERILIAYEQDFSKHAPASIVPRIRMLWKSIPSQLVKENKKFLYGLIKEGARAKDYEMALMWLYDCGLVHKVSRVNKPGIPLVAYEDLKAFKLFLLDVGLLSCMVNLPQETLINGNQLFVEFKGALTEQFVLQQLSTFHSISIYYWSNPKGSAEIDFVISDGRAIYPLEVKAEVNVKAKSLRQYREMFSPALAIRLSLQAYKKEEGLLNLPLWAVHTLKNVIKK